ncbi:nucleotide exchange factor GrpE [Clostridium sp. HCP1S3_B4]|uniref:nucleotide exchange factor GrpE n=1 Tax=unclassified Clostridium TaxID=2614128 RepID=UPI001696EF16|nr:nucleotide exchange factor GrpE [Clostridiales bacterium]MDY2728463.1 nucleotide exchange factor GrpE [Clostridium sp.]NLK23697.1 nucleotide exchange factor GrpE [Clostridiales bacterium]
MTNKEKDVKLEDENLEKDNVSEEENVIENEDNNLNENTENNEEDESKENSEDTFTMLRKSKDEVKKLTNEVQTLKDRLLRQTAEYDNFRKRTAKEKEGIYTDACVDVLKEILPVADNLERAILAEGNFEDLKKGIEMTIKGLQSAFEKLGVEEIDASKDFDPNLHQAVMHVEDENFDKNQVAEVFMKGYKRGEKVIRHSVVKVAN